MLDWLQKGLPLDAPEPDDDMIHDNTCDTDDDDASIDHEEETDDPDYWYFVCIQTLLFNNSSFNYSCIYHCSFNYCP